MTKVDKKYIDLLSKVKECVRVGQVKTVMSANGQMLWIYWQIGNFILENQSAKGWGSKIIPQLSKDLKKEFPAIKGFSPRNMLYMKQFAACYSAEKLTLFIFLEKEIRTKKLFTQQAVAQLQKAKSSKKLITQQAVAQFTEDDFLKSIAARISWSHHIILLDKAKDDAQKFWYALHALENGVSRNVLAMQVEAQLFNRQIKAKKVSNFKNTLPEPQTDFAHYIMKDPYIFDFVQAQEKADERNIEEQLTQHITKFLLELGQGFAFVGRQVHLSVGDSDYFIDLLFYHTQLHAYVVVELKTGDFKPGDASQLNFYLNVVNDKLKKEGDNDTIGLLLCKGKNEVVAEYSLRGLKQPIGVADYQLSKAVPKELKSKLPNIKDLEKEMDTK